MSKRYVEVTGNKDWDLGQDLSLSDIIKQEMPEIRGKIIKRLF